LADFDRKIGPTIDVIRGVIPLHLGALYDLHPPLRVTKAFGILCVQVESDDERGDVPLYTRPELLKKVQEEYDRSGQKLEKPLDTPPRYK
jgi:hypothetical protein